MTHMLLLLFTVACPYTYTIALYVVFLLYHMHLFLSFNHFESNKQEIFCRCLRTCLHFCFPQNVVTVIFVQVLQISTI